MTVTAEDREAVRAIEQGGPRMIRCMAPEAQLRLLDELLDGQDRAGVRTVALIDAVRRAIAERREPEQPDLLAMCNCGRVAAWHDDCDGACPPAYER